MGVMSSPFATYGSQEKCHQGYESRKAIPALALAVALRVDPEPHLDSTVEA